MICKNIDKWWMSMLHLSMNINKWKSITKDWLSIHRFFSCSSLFCLLNDLVLRENFLVHLELFVDLFKEKPTRKVKKKIDPNDNSDDTCIVVYFIVQTSKRWPKTTKTIRPFNKGTCFSFFSWYLWDKIFYIQIKR